MTPEEKFMFDLEGYLVVKNVLTQDEVDELNALADQAFPGEYDETGLRRTSRVSRWGPPAQALIDHHKLLPYFDGLLGPHFRIDHDYCIFMRKGGKGGRLHGGPRMQLQSGVPGDHWYECYNGLIRNGLTVFTYCLSHAQDGDGGFACIPGTHKTNFLADVPDDVRLHERRAHYVAQPEVEAGDVIIFTEALVHGTMPWTADHERRSLLYKYSPGHSSWSDGYYDPDVYQDVTEQQRRIMTSPSIGGREASVIDD
ncbi:MAG: phytanoyl-CoA dioxygenase family protein [Gemmatimonadota bacterium]|nr:phytanoyl-CoA dioxygenase family protein [Gemmatimonadota bacterium]